MSVFIALLLAAIGMFALMSLLWVYQKAKGEADIVDAGWAAGLALVAIFYAIIGPGDFLRNVLFAFAVAFWGFRLAFYLFVQRVLKPGEDGRYQALRSSWGTSAQKNFFLFFQFQSLLVVVLSLSFIAVAWNPLPAPRILDILALLICLVSILGESLADRQLSSFRNNPENHGKTCREGLWRYSRHPNYFFEWFHWWGYVLFSWGSSYAWMSWIAPFFMLYFIMKVTGIPPTEARALKSRPDDYRDYQRTTSSFIPWFPKR